MFGRLLRNRQADENLRRLQALPPRFQRMVTERNYPLDLVERTAHFIGYADFPLRVEQLSPKFQQMVLMEDYPLDLAEDIVRLMGLPKAKLIKELFTEQQARAFMFPRFLACMLTENGVMALREGLMTPEYAASVLTFSTLVSLLSDHTLRELRKQGVRLTEPGELSEVSELTEITERGGGVLRG